MTNFKRTCLRVSCILIVLQSSISIGQHLKHFEADFLKATEADFTETDLNDMFKNYYNLLTPHSNVNQVLIELNRADNNLYPLLSFKSTALYTNNISGLLNNENQYKRLLSYWVIASSGDTNYENELFQKLKVETVSNNLKWIVLGLMNLRTKKTTTLFDALIENESLFTAHIFPLLYKLDAKDLRKTAYSRIESQTINAKILAVQLLSVTKKNKKTEKLLRKAILDWDLELKKYPINALNKLQVGNLKTLLAPLLKHPKIFKVAIEALINSPTKVDVQYVKKRIDSSHTVSKDILNGFSISDKKENLKYWLKLISGFKIPDNYYFSTFRKPLLFLDDLLVEVHETLRETKHVSVKRHLIEALEGRSDSISNIIFLDFLNHPDHGVRYHTVKTLKDSKSPIIIEKLVELIKDPEKRVFPIITILIKNNIDNLQDVYTKIYENTNSRKWQHSAIRYLSRFPLKEHIILFEEILNTENLKVSIYRNVAQGLGSLGNSDSVERIIELSEKESSKDDSNCYYYIKALLKMKGFKAKNYVLSFKDSNSKQIIELLKDLN